MMGAFWPDAHDERFVTPKTKWTTERPKREGWYWWRRNGRVSIVQVIWEPWDSEGNGEFEVHGDGILWGLHALSGEWQAVKEPEA